MRMPGIEHLMMMNGELEIYEDNGYKKEKKEQMEFKCFFTEKDGTIRKNGENGVLTEIERKGIVRVGRGIFDNIKEYINDPDIEMYFLIDGLEYRVEHVNINRNPNGSIHHIRMDVV